MKVYVVLKYIDVVIDTKFIDSIWENYQDAIQRHQLLGRSKSEIETHDIL